MSPLADTSPNPLLIFSRQSTSIADQAKTALSSWPNCMAVAYCKWPVIVAIIIGALIVFSVVFCIARVCCCGVECCCMCCSCFNACCPSPRGRKTKTKYVEAPQQQFAPPQQPYGFQAPMNYGGGGGGFQSTPARNYSQPTFNQPKPQFATFETSSGKQITEDSLPAMPSWQTAQKRQVEIEPETAVIDDDDKVSNIGEEHGIAMGALPPGGRKVKDDDAALYEDPEDLRKPILQDQHTGQDKTRLGYADGAADPYGYEQSEYGESVATGPSHTQPAHSYNNHINQVNEMPYGGQDGRSPTSQSQYSSGYPPTYSSRAPTYESRITSPYDSRNPTYPSRTPNYGPGSASFNRDPYLQSPHSTPSPPPGGPYRSPTSPQNKGFRGPNVPQNNGFRGPSPPQNGGPYRGPASPPGGYSREDYGPRLPGTRGPPHANYDRRLPGAPSPTDTYNSHNTAYPSQNTGYDRSYSPTPSTQYEPTQYEAPTTDRLPSSLMAGQPSQRSYAGQQQSGQQNYISRRPPGGY